MVVLLTAAVLIVTKTAPCWRKRWRRWRRGWYSWEVPGTSFWHQRRRWRWTWTIQERRIV